MCDVMKLTNEFMDNENKRYETVCGEVVFHSRSVAVCVHIYAEVEGEMYVAALQRGERMDHGGMWCMPCGYLDWNESAETGARREVMEELGIKPDALGELEFLGVEDEPEAYKQNITFVYRARVDGLLALCSAGAAEGEVQEMRWMNVTEVREGKHVGACGHDTSMLQELEQQN